MFTTTTTPLTTTTGRCTLIGLQTRSVKSADTTPFVFLLPWCFPSTEEKKEKKKSLVMDWEPRTLTRTLTDTAPFSHRIPLSKHGASVTSTETIGLIRDGDKGGRGIELGWGGGGR